jgi:hypothetical protein
MSLGRWLRYPVGMGNLYTMGKRQSWFREAEWDRIIARLFDRVATSFTRLQARKNWNETTTINKQIREAEARRMGLCARLVGTFPDR